MITYGPSFQADVATFRDTCLEQGAGWARLNRLRVEETGEAVGVREIQTEQSVHRGLCIENTLSQSWEDLTLVGCAVRLQQITSLLSYQRCRVRARRRASSPAWGPVTPAGAGLPRPVTP